MPWKQLLAHVTGSIDEELRLRNEYLVTENRILRSKLTGRIRFNDEERRELRTVGKQVGRKALEAIATIVKPATILRWHADLVARKFDGSGYRQSLGRPPISTEVVLCQNSAGPLYSPSTTVSFGSPIRRKQPSEIRYLFFTR